MSEDNKSKASFTGVVVGKPLKIGTKKQTTYGIGKEFSTTNEKLFNSLVKDLKIKPSKKNSK